MVFKISNSIIVLAFLVAACAKMEPLETGQSSSTKGNSELCVGSSCGDLENMSTDFEDPKFKGEIDCTLTASPSTTTVAGTAVTLTLNVKTSGAQSAVLNNIYNLTVPTGSLKLTPTQTTNYIAKVTGVDGKVGQCGVSVIVDTSSGSNTNPTTNPTTTPVSSNQICQVPLSTGSVSATKTCTCAAGTTLISATALQGCSVQKSGNTVFCSRVNLVTGSAVNFNSCQGCVYTCR